MPARLTGDVAGTSLTLSSLHAVLRIILALLTH